MEQRAIFSLVAVLLSACVAPDRGPEINITTTTELAEIASKACTDKFGARTEFAVSNWRIRINRDMWLVETRTNQPPRDCYGIYISMSDRTPDFLGCLICATLS